VSVCLSDRERRHQKSIIASLKDPDVSIRRRALDLLFTMTNEGNADEIVTELLKYLNVADFSMREELVLKTAVLAERCDAVPHMLRTQIDRARCGPMGEGRGLKNRCLLPRCW
jgi:Adaptin N terminal region